MLKQAVFLATLTCTAISAAAQQSTDPAQSQPDSRANSQIPPINAAVFPEPAQAMPPNVPPRPALIPPAPPAAASNEGWPIIAAKPSLAWRAKAQELKVSQQALSRTLSAHLDDVIMSLAVLLPKFNYKVETLNSKSGELLAGDLDPTIKQKLIFVFSEPVQGTVLVKAAPLPASKQVIETITTILLAITPDASRSRL